MIPHIKRKSARDHLQEDEYIDKISFMRRSNNPQHQVNQIMMLRHTFQHIIFGIILGKSMPGTFKNPKDLGHRQQEVNKLR